MCPECGGDNIRVVEFDFGRCPETGYHDAGERYDCHDCGAYGDADEIVFEDAQCNVEYHSERLPAITWTPLQDSTANPESSRVLKVMEEVMPSRWRPNRRLVSLLFLAYSSASD